MKKVLFLTLLSTLNLNNSYASIQLDEVIDEASTEEKHLKTEKEEVRKPQNMSKKAENFAKKNQIKTEKTEENNIPKYAQRSKPSLEFDNPTHISKSPDSEKHSQIFKGDTLKVLIQQSIVAYSDSNAPISGFVLEGEMKGSTVFGQATLDSVTKKINIRFTSIRPKTSKQTYTIEGQTTELSGELGLPGNFESHYWDYFVAESVSKAISGYAEGSISKSKNIFGSYEEEITPGSAAKKGIAEGFKSISQRMGEKASRAPEFATLKGPILTNVIILN